jgi:hypothetical protein
VAEVIGERPSAWMLSWETRFLNRYSYGPRPSGLAASVPARSLGPVREGPSFECFSFSWLRAPKAWTNEMGEWENCREYVGGVMQ